MIVNLTPADTSNNNQKIFYLIFEPGRTTTGKLYNREVNKNVVSGVFCGAPAPVPTLPRHFPTRSDYFCGGGDPPGPPGPKKIKKNRDFWVDLTFLLGCANSG